MGTYSKIAVMALILPSLLLLSSLSVYGQPLGIMSPQAQKKTQNKILSSENGRFIFGQISDSSKDQFMLDTLTGRLWRIAESGKIGIFLKSVPYRTEEGKCSALPRCLSDSAPKKTGKK
ncbi:MAG TPA: hypothetical protein DDW42_00565 [Desulfobacteraceae bacterium]|nr:hypothetical protein [Desulfobacteraceae bacterium]